MLEHEQKSEQKLSKTNGAGAKALQLIDNRESPVQQQKSNNTGLPDQFPTRIAGVEELAHETSENVAPQHATSPVCKSETLHQTLFHQVFSRCYARVAPPPVEFHLPHMAHIACVKITQ